MNESQLVKNKNKSQEYSFPLRDIVVALFFLFIKLFSQGFIETSMMKVNIVEM